MPARRGGQAPKDPDQQANKSRANAAKAQIRVVTAETTHAPELPDMMPVRNPYYGRRDDDGELLEPDAQPFYEWPDMTRRWWHSWTHNPLTEDYRDSDWLDLLDCAVIHGRLWNGDMKAAAELRLRMARHGATREDRARLRIVFATADQAEMKTNTGPKQSGKTSRERRGGLRGESNDRAQGTG